MKKNVVFAAVLSIVLMIPVSAATLKAETAPDYKVVIDGVVQEFKDAKGNKVEPVVINGVTYLPLEPLADAFGKDVSWNKKTSTITISSGSSGKESSGKSAKLINVTSATAMNFAGNYSTSSVAKVSGEESLTFSIGGKKEKFSSAVKVKDINSAKKTGGYELTGSYKTLSCTLLYVTDKTDECVAQITDVDTGVDIVNKTLEPNKPVKITNADISGVKRINFSGQSTTAGGKAGTLYILNPTVQ